MATKDTNYLVAVHKGLDESLEKQVAALPEKFNKQRFLQNCMTVLQDGQADFSKCEAPTVVRTLLKGAFLGLDFFNGECYAIPYGNQCQFQTDYKGEIKLCNGDYCSGGRKHERTAGMVVGTEGVKELRLQLRRGICKTAGGVPKSCWNGGKPQRVGVDGFRPSGNH